MWSESISKWMKGLVLELGSNSGVLIDRRGFIIAQYNNIGGDKIKVLMTLLSNYFLAVDSILGRHGDEVKYAVFELNESIYLGYKIKVNGEPLYLLLAYDRVSIPLGAILIKLEGLDGEVSKLISEISGRREDLGGGLTEDELNKLIEKIDKDPILRMILTRREDNKS